MPKISAKNITDRMSLVDMAVMMLLGMMARKAATPRRLVGLAGQDRSCPLPGIVEHRLRLRLVDAGAGLEEIGHRERQDDGDPGDERR